MATQTIPRPGALGDVGRKLGEVPRWIYAALAVLLIVAIVALTLVTRAKSATQYVTQPVTQGQLVQSVIASGTVNPQNTITVGSQVSGTISQIDADFNSKVTKGEVLARIDPSTIQAQLDQAEAQQAQAAAQADAAGENASSSSSTVSVSSANANADQAAVTAANANVVKAQSATTLAQAQYNRDAALLKQGYVAQETVDTDSANVAQDQSAVAAAQAAAAQAVAQAQAGTSQIGASGYTAAGLSDTAAADRAAAQAAAATVAQDQVNLNNTVITSPVNGTVISRAVSIGQTVAASLSAPTIFTIAQDLTKMEVDINVGEPDIGNVKAGDIVNFSVLAYPNQNFVGNVTQVRINPTTVNNVVTYDVITDVDNTAGKLLPGMTANATIDVASVNNALIVPLAAVHAAKASTGSPWGTVTGTSATANLAVGQSAFVMVKNGSKVTRIPVTVQLVTTSQAAVTPAQSGALNAGDSAVIGISSGSPKDHTGGATRSPIMGGGAAGATRGIH